MHLQDKDHIKGQRRKVHTGTFKGHALLLFKVLSISIILRFSFFFFFRERKGETEPWENNKLWPVDNIIY